MTKFIERKVIELINQRVMKKIDFTKLQGEALFYYFTNDYEDKNYSSIIEMLPYAVMDKDKALALLERVVREKKTFVVVYPGEEKTDTSKMEYVGDVIDGGIYIK
jgi:hypothetical protein